MTNSLMSSGTQDAFISSSQASQLFQGPGIQNLSVIQPGNKRKETCFCHADTVLLCLITPPNIKGSAPVGIKGLL